MNKLIVQTIQTFFFGVIALGMVLFLPAWTFSYWQAWVFIAVFMASISAIGIYLSIRDAELLERRKNIGPAAEQNTAQKIIMSIALLGNIGLLVFCAFDNRFGWSSVSPFVSVMGDVLVALGLLIIFVVFRENTFGASNVQVADEQKVISTGPYAYVRHPMYVGVIVMIAGVPLALGSWWGLAILLLVLPMLAWRIIDEESLLKKELKGYSGYAQKVRYRLVPYLW